MKTWTRYAIGYSVFAVANYMVAKATAGTVRTGTSQQLLGLNDALLKLNVLAWFFGEPTAPLAAGTQPVVTQDDVVVAPPGISGYMARPVGNVVPLR